MTKVQTWQVPVTIACLLTGVFLVNAFRTNTAYQNTRTDLNKNKNLVGIIHYLEKETGTLEDRVKQLRKEIDTIQKNQVTGSKNAQLLQNEMEEYKYAVGLTDSRAPGITITLDDNKAGADAARASNPAQFDANDYLVHDKNILYLVTTLRNAGAKVISVNDQRVITTTSIRCAGPIILVNSSRLAPPYIIKAQGDPVKLTTAVEKSDEYAYIQSKNLPIQISKQYNLLIPAYTGPIKFSYAQIQKEGAK